MKKITEKCIGQIGANCLCALGIIMLVAGLFERRFDAMLLGMAVWVIGKAS